MAELTPYESVQKELSKYEAAANRLLAALAEATSVDEVTEVKDKAEALRALAHIAGNREAEAKALEIRLRAERRIGELIKAQSDTEGLNTGTRGKGRPKRKGGSQQNPPKVDTRPTLKEALGANHKSLAHRARKISAIPADDFEKAISVIHTIAEKEPGRPLTLNLLAPATEYAPRREPVRKKVKGNSKTRLITAECMMKIRDAVGALKRPVTHLLKNPPTKSAFLPGYMKKLEHYLTLMRTWDEKSQQSEEVAVPKKAVLKKAVPKKAAKPKSNTTTASMGG